MRSPLPTDTPGTNLIIATNLATFVLIFLRLFPTAILPNLVLTTGTVWQAPWGFFTYPLVSIPGGLYSLINLLFGLFWLYILGSLLERSWGTRRFLFVFFGFSAISALFLAIGGMLLGINVEFGQLYTPLVDLTVIWALLDPSAPVLFFFFPMQLKWLAVLVCAFLFFDYGQISPILGVFSLGGPAVAWLYFASRNRPRGTYYRGGSSGPRSGRFAFWNPFEWYRRWKFRRRFKKLWGG